MNTRMVIAPPVNDPAILEARAIEFRHSAEAPLLGPVSFTVGARQLVGVLGPNGAGKSTLLRLAAGLLRPARGELLLSGRPTTAYSAGVRARQLAFLPQHPQAPGATTGEEIVRLGRHPYRGWGIFESPQDLHVVREVMGRTDTLAFAVRRMDTLSGGEAQRVHVAAALAQQPRLLVLDEPTADLDLRQQLRIFMLLRSLTRDDGLAALVVTHDVNLAAQYCDHVLVLDQGRVALNGRPADVLQPDRLAGVYGVRFQSVTIPSSAAPAVVAVGLAEAGETRSATL